VASSWSKTSKSPPSSSCEVMNVALATSSRGRLDANGCSLRCRRVLSRADVEALACEVFPMG
jgi:hypothetical protein